MTNRKLPPTLLMLQPLLWEIGWEWSTHYESPDGPWCVVQRDGRAGRVGMSESQAAECVIQMVTARLKASRETLKAGAAQMLMTSDLLLAKAADLGSKE